MRSSGFTKSRARHRALSGCMRPEPISASSFFVLRWEPLILGYVRIRSLDWSLIHCLNLILGYRSLCQNTENFVVICVVQARIQNSISMKQKSIQVCEFQAVDQKHFSSGSGYSNMI